MLIYCCSLGVVYIARVAKNKENEGSRKKSNFSCGPATKALPPPPLSSLVAIETFF